MIQQGAISKKLCGVKLTNAERGSVPSGHGATQARSKVLFEPTAAQYQDEQRQGSSMQRLAYLPEQIRHYALAEFTTDRGEEKRDWATQLRTVVRSYFKQSRRWVATVATSCDGSIVSSVSWGKPALLTHFFCLG